MRLISAARLDLAMTEVGVSSSDLARCCGYKSHSYVSRLRRGVPGSRSVQPRVAERIAKRLGVEVLWLFEPVGVKSPDSTRVAA